MDDAALGGGSDVFAAIMAAVLRPVAQPSPASATKPAGGAPDGAARPAAASFKSKVPSTASASDGKPQSGAIQARADGAPSAVSSAAARPGPATTNPVGANAAAAQLPASLAGAGQVAAAKTRQTPAAPPVLKPAAAMSGSPSPAEGQSIARRQSSPPPATGGAPLPQPPDANPHIVAAGQPRQPQAGSSSGAGDRPNIPGGVVRVLFQAPAPSAAADAASGASGASAPEANTAVPEAVPSVPLNSAGVFNPGFAIPGAPPPIDQPAPTTRPPTLAPGAAGSLAQPASVAAASLATARVGDAAASVQAATLAVTATNTGTAPEPFPTQSAALNSPGRKVASTAADAKGKTIAPPPALPMDPSAQKPAAIAGDQPDSQVAKTSLAPADDGVSDAGADQAQTPASSQPLAGGPAQTTSAATHAATTAQEGAAVHGAPETVAHLTAELARKLEARTTRFQIELQPAGLGRVDVNVAISANGALSASLNFDSVHSAELLRAHGRELHAALEKAGFNVSAGGLSFTSGGGFSSPQGGAGGEPAPSVAPGRATTAAAEPQRASEPRRQLAAGRLDIRI